MINAQWFRTHWKSDKNIPLSQERVSERASERASGWASGPLLISRFQKVLNHCEMGLCIHEHWARLFAACGLLCQFYEDVRDRMTDRIGARWLQFVSPLYLLRSCFVGIVVSCPSWPLQSYVSFHVSSLGIIVATVIPNITQSALTLIQHIPENIDIVNLQNEVSEEDVW